jgi:hypothetical protein
MAHTTATTVSIETVSADRARGSIAGFELRCSDCGFVARTSLGSIARRDAYEHVEYMLGLEARRASLGRTVSGMVPATGERWTIRLDG